MLSLIRAGNRILRSVMLLLLLLAGLAGSTADAWDDTTEPTLTEDALSEDAVQPLVELAATSETVSWPSEQAALVSNAFPDRRASSGFALANDGFRVTAYGAFWADMIFATQRTNPGAFTLFVFSPQQQGETAFTIDARRSRFGLDVTGPRIPTLGETENGGRVEVDFHGDFVTENRASVLLRQAYWELKGDRFRLLVGQTWDVISPLNPGMLDYAVGLNAGNIGFRRAQFRGERYVPFSDELQIMLQASLNQDIVIDFPAEAGVRREASGWPVVEGRLAMNWAPGDDDRAIVVGLSGHIGETGFDFIDAGPPPTNLPPEDDGRFKTWSLNVDLQFPITKRFGVQGEFFTGANLSAFFGGIGQGVCPCLREPIRATGGWGELWFDWSPRLHSHAGYGLDDPNNRDTLFGRTYNQMIFANVILDLTDRLLTGLEVTYRTTLYQDTRAGQIPPEQLAPTETGEAVTVDWMVKYEF